MTCPVTVTSNKNGDHTFNAWWGCEKVSPGCKNCYAETFSKRYKWDIWGPGKDRRIFPDKHWNEPLKWNREAMAAGKPAKVFLGSMMDWAERNAPESERAKIFPLIKRTPWLRYLMLTKRPEDMPLYLPKDWSPQNYPNVWLGTSIENNDYVWRAEALVQVPAAIHFLSLEPLLGPVTDLDYTDIEWCIVGGESGSGYREMQEEWVVEICDACLLKGIAFFYKQDGGAYSGMIAKGSPFEGEQWRQFPR